ncbi:hypothetical protein [Nocardioides mangrovi]|uniref:Uncharacterized protein n=1 Tax=Nocardioides mangrovi TaxID=2874580 RepID=A0ABS7UAU4_9ACTN|nr:hypothetical protein [Nocardioides mangrovi]MBZ5738114.1 hypothetical protein [Nocardioides mangrovi]
MRVHPAVLRGSARDGGLRRAGGRSLRGGCRGQLSPVHLPALPGPRDLPRLLERASAFVDDLAGLVPRTAALITAAEELLAEADALLRRTAAVVDRVDATREAADVVVASATDPVRRTTALLDQLEPTFADLPALTVRIEEVVPVVAGMDNVSGDLRRLLEIVGQLDELVGHLPGMGRIRKRLEEESAGEQPA